MISYWCKFFAASGHIFGAEKMMAADDAAAMAKAAVIFAWEVGSGYEIWDRNRLVQRYVRVGR